MNGNSASSSPLPDNRKGIIVAHMQARIKPPHALPVIIRQRKRLEAFVEEFGIRVDWWRARVKGMVPIPTIEDAILRGKVYAVIAYEWDKTQPCKGLWPDLWDICGENRVRLIIPVLGRDTRHYGESSLFWDEWRWERPSIISPYPKKSSQQ